MLSTANERANIKGILPKYVAGVILIAFCATIAAATAGVASKAGDNTAGGIVDKGFELGKLNSGDRNFEEYNGKLGEYEKKTTLTTSYGKIDVYLPEYAEVKGIDYLLKAIRVDEEIGTQTFKYWGIRIIKDEKIIGQTYEDYNILFYYNLLEIDADRCVVYAVYGD